MRIRAAAVLLSVPLIALSASCKSTGGGNAASLKDGPGGAQSGDVQVMGTCTLSLKRPTRKIVFEIKPAGGPHSVAFSVDGGAWKPLEGFEEAQVQIDGKDIYVGGAGDGDAGYFTLTKTPAGITGALHFPNSPADGTGLKGDGAEYRVTCQGSTVAAAVPESAPIAAGIPADTIECRMAARRHKPYYALRIKVGGDTAPVQYLKYAQWGSSAGPLATGTLEGFESASISRSSGFMQVLGAADGDAGFINIRYSKRNVLWGGGLYFPNSPSLDGLKGDGRRYNLKCEGKPLVQPAPASNFPAHLAAVEILFQEIGEYVDEGGTDRLASITSANYQERVRKSFHRSIAEVMTFQPLTSENELASFLADWLDFDGDSVNSQRAAKVWTQVQGHGLKVHRFEANGEDGIFYINGFVVVDDASKKAVLVYNRTSA